MKEKGATLEEVNSLNAMLLLMTRQPLLTRTDQMGVNGKDWYVTMTTCKQREFSSVADRTEKSLCDSGFELDAVSIDESGIGIVANFTIAAWEAYVREPHCQRFLFIQDDVLFPKNLRAYLESLGDLPPVGYWNLYITPENENRVPRTPGFHKSNQMGRGALALAFSNHALRRILSSCYFVNKLREASRNSRKSLDRAIVKGCEEVGGAEYVHWPALCQHIGTQSTLGNEYHEDLLPQSWKGEDFDCLSLIKEKERSPLNAQ